MDAAMRWFVDIGTAQHARSAHRHFCYFGQMLPASPVRAFLLLSSAQIVSRKYLLFEASCYANRFFSYRRRGADANFAFAP
jgi:hypothetical protein